MPGSQSRLPSCQPWSHAPSRHLVAYLDSAAGPPAGQDAGTNAAVRSACMGIATSLEEVATASAGDAEYGDQARGSGTSEPAGNRFAAAVKAAQAAQGAEGVPAQL